MSDEPKFTISEFMKLPLNRTYCEALKLPDTTTLADLLALYAELRNKKSQPSVPASAAERTPAEEGEFYKLAEQKLFSHSAEDDGRCSCCGREFEPETAPRAN